MLPQQDSLSAGPSYVLQALPGRTPEWITASMSFPVRMICVRWLRKLRCMGALT